MNYVVSSLSLIGLTIARDAISAVSGGSASSGPALAEAGTAADDEEAGGSVVAAGAELGGYLFLGSTIQIFGIGMTTAGRAAFIVQLTTVIVPLLDAFLNKRRPQPKTLGACLLAFLGVLILTTAGAPDASAAGDVGSSSTLLGDGLVGLSAIAYSLHVVRLSFHAPRMAPTKLARAKEISRFCYASIVLAIGVAVSSTQADALAAFTRSFTEAPDAAAIAFGIVLWNGLVTTAFPTWAQSFGQSAVSAGTASVIYTLQPLWSTLFGFLLLGETFTAQGGAGAAVILLAVLSVAVDTSGGKAADE